MHSDILKNSFEESRSLKQELTFTTLQNELNRRNLEFGFEQMKMLKLIGDDKLFTNLALLLSDQCAHTIKIAVFQGTDNAIFRDRREFSGSVLKQLEDAYNYLDLQNKTKATFSGLYRTDTRDYPEDALREALLNSIIHRDYLFSGSTIINVFDDRIEFISLGGLVSGITMESIFLGASQSRNPNLAAVFYRLRLVESYGTGIRKILRLYDGFEPLPAFRTAEGVFVVEMKNRNEAKVQSKNTLKDDIYEFVKTKQEVTRKDIENTFGFGSTKAYKYLKMLCDEGVISQKLNGNRTVYRLEI